MHGYNVREGKGSAPKVTRGIKKRGLVFDPVEVFNLLRDTWDNAPIPKDANFEGVAIEKSGAGSFICFYYSTYQAGNSEAIILRPISANFDPLSHCVALKPQQLLDILKYWFDGKVPLDAEARAFYINKNWCQLCLEVVSDHFPDSNAVKLPMIHLSYDTEKVVVFDDQKNQSEIKVN